MKKILVILAVLSMAAAAWAAPAERYLHVKVNDSKKQQNVSINLPLSVAAQVIPAIDHGRLSGGKIQVGNFEVNGVDLRQIFDALKTAPDGEYVTVQQPGQQVRVAKKNGVLIVHVRNTKDDQQTVDANIPWAVAEALVSSDNPHELNLEAAIQALASVGNTTLVTVTSNQQNVRVWIDSQSTMQ